MPWSTFDWRFRKEEGRRNDISIKIALPQKNIFLPSEVLNEVVKPLEAPPISERIGFGRGTNWERYKYRIHSKKLLLS